MFLPTFIIIYYSCNLNNIKIFYVINIFNISNIEQLHKNYEQFQKIFYLNTSSRYFINQNKFVINVKSIFFINKRHSINITLCYLFDVKRINFRLVLYTLLFYNILQCYK